MSSHSRKFARRPAGAAPVKPVEVRALSDADQVIVASVLTPLGQALTNMQVAAATAQEQVVRAMAAAHKLDPAKGWRMNLGPPDGSGPRWERYRVKP
jgi:hypothetical protein